jgi:GTPase SAR1 family protein
MLYPTAQHWREAKHKKVLLFGMSGLGKTHLSNLLRANGNWYHYSIDYRIGTRYMGEYIVDNAKREAMKNPFLRDLLMTDSIYLGSNITFDNLAPLSSYLGKPGNPELGGLPFDDYMHRQDQHREAEIAALLDTAYFIDRAQGLYQYDHFVCDSGGSICEVVDPNDPEDPVLTALSQNALMIWIKGATTHTEELVRRFDKAPKPMYYQPQFLESMWQEYLKENNCLAGDVDPNAFIRFTYARALAHRQPRYQAMAENWGVTVTAEQVAKVHDAAGFEAMIAGALETR